MRDIYQDVTNRILGELENGTAVWRKPWHDRGGFPVNVNTGRPYRGINVLLLMLNGMGYTDPRWGTFDAVRSAAANHARSEGREIVIEESLKNGRKVKKYWEIVDGERVWFKGGVRKGEKGTHIILQKRVPKKDPEEGEKKEYFLMRDYVVFNVEQCIDIPSLEFEERDFTPIEAAEKILNSYVLTPGSGNPGPPVVFGGNRASYSLIADRIQLPEAGQFISDETYYGTLFHELIHSTGHEKRLPKGRTKIEPALFGSDPYAKEELVAEVGASFLCGMAGIDGIDESASYLGGWLKKLQDDRRLIFSAASEAQKAADLILGTTFEKEENENEEAQLQLVA